MYVGNKEARCYCRWSVFWHHISLCAAALTFLCNHLFFLGRFLVECRVNNKRCFNKRWDRTKKNILAGAKSNRKSAGFFLIDKSCVFFCFVRNREVSEKNDINDEWCMGHAVATLGKNRDCCSRQDVYRYSQNQSIQADSQRTLVASLRRSNNRSS